jgi:hypothetical protein
MRRIGAALAVAALAPAVLAAQRVWVDQLYPYAYYSTIDGFWIAGRYGWFSPMGRTDRPEPNYASIKFDAAASTQGSYLLSVDAAAPAYWDGWRLALSLTAARANRLGYYGQGNATPYDADSVTPAAPYFYWVSRTTRAARLTVQRRVVGPLRLLAGASLEHTNFRELPGDSRLWVERVVGIVCQGWCAAGSSSTGAIRRPTRTAASSLRASSGVGAGTRARPPRRGCTCIRSRS